MQHRDSLAISSAQASERREGDVRFGERERPALDLEPSMPAHRSAVEPLRALDVELTKVVEGIQEGHRGEFAVFRIERGRACWRGVRC